MATVGEVEAVLKARDEMTAVLQKASGSMSDLKTKIGETSTATDKMGGLMGMIGPRIAAAFSIGSVTAFAKSVMDAAGHYQDLADKTGVSVGALQRWDYVAQQSGTSADDLANLVLQLSRRLAGGDESAEAGLTKLGLSAKALMAMGPEKALEAISAELAKMKNPAEQTTRAWEIFGRSSGAVLAALKSDLAAAGAGAKTMSDDTVAALDDLGDALVKTKQNAVALAGEGFMGLLNALNPFLAAQREAIALAKAQSAAIEASRASFDALTQSEIEVNQAQAQLAAGQKWIKQGYDALDPAVAKAARAMLAHGASMEEVKKVMQLTDGQMRLLTVTTKQLAKEEDDAAEAAKKAAKAAKEFAEWLKNTAVPVSTLSDLVEKKLVRSMHLLTAEMEPYDTALAMGTVSLADFTNNMARWGDVLGPIGPMQQKTTKDTTNWSGALGQLGEVLGEIAEIDGNRFLQFLGALVSLSTTGIQAITDLSKALGSMKTAKASGDMAAYGAASLAAASASASLVGAVIALDLMWASYIQSQSDIRQAVQDTTHAFIRQQGGLANLTRELQTAGLAARDWHAYIEQGGNSVKLAEANIKRLTAALDALHARQKAAAQAGALFSELIAQWAAAGNVTAESFQRMGAYAVAAIAAMMKNGMSLFQALKANAQALDTLIAKAKELGISGTGAIAELMRFREVQAQFEAILEPLDLQVQLIQALTAAGVQSQAAYEALAASAVAAYEQMTANGVDTLMALGQIQPALQILWEAWKSGKYAIDDATAALLRQAEEAGLVGEQHKNINEQLIALFGELRDAIDAMTAAIKGWGDEAVDAYNRARGAAVSYGQAVPRGSPIAPNPPDAGGGGAMPRESYGPGAGGGGAFLWAGGERLAAEASRLWSGEIGHALAAVSHGGSTSYSLGSLSAGDIAHGLGGGRPEQVIIVKLDGRTLVKSQIENFPEVAFLRGERS